MSRSMPAVVRLRAPVPPAAPTRPRRRVSRARARLRLIYPVIAIAAAAATLVVLLGGRGVAPPATGAARIVPGDALAYIHLSTDPSRPSVRDAEALAGRFPDFPLLAAAVRQRLAAVLDGAGPPQFERDIQPWLGKEAAVALLSATPSSADMLFVLSVANLDGARSFLAHGAGASYASSERGVAILAEPSGTHLALVHGYVVAGTDFAVRAAIDTATGATPSLALDADYERASGDEPPGRVLDAYASEPGVRRLLVGRTGALGALGALLDRPSLGGVAVSVSPASGGARAHVHFALDPMVTGLARTRRAAFAPTLQSVIPSGSTLMLDLAGIGGSGSRLLDAASAAGVAGRIAPLLHRLGAALSVEGVNVPAVLSLFSGETALAVGPGQSGTPSLLLVSRVRSEQDAKAKLAALESPLSQLFAPAGGGGGQAPIISYRQVGAATVHELALGPGLQLDYAVARGLVIIGTSLSGVTSVVERARALSGDPGYRAVVPGSPRAVSSLVFLDLRQLLSLGEQVGLFRSARYEALRPDLMTVRAASLESRSEESESTAELLLQIS